MLTQGHLNRLLLLQECSNIVGATETNNDNRGDVIDIINKDISVPLGSDWCAAMIQYAIKQFVGHREHLADNPSKGYNCGIYRSAVCLEIFNKSQDALVTDGPRMGDLIIWQFEKGNHIGIIKDILAHDRANVIEGNTTDPKKKFNDGCYIKNRSILVDNRITNKQMKILGFLRPFYFLDK